MNTVCKHPKVRVVAREEDAEYVECQDCGEVFDSNEFHDMAIEENGELDPDEIEKKIPAGKPLRSRKKA